MSAPVRLDMIEKRGTEPAHDVLALCRALRIAVAALQWQKHAIHRDDPPGECTAPTCRALCEIAALVTVEKP